MRFLDYSAVRVPDWQRIGWTKLGQEYLYDSTRNANSTRAERQILMRHRVFVSTTKMASSSLIVFTGQLAANSQMRVRKWQPPSVGSSMDNEPSRKRIPDPRSLFLIFLTCATRWRTGTSSWMNFAHGCSSWPIRRQSQRTRAFPQTLNSKAVVRKFLVEEVDIERPLCKLGTIRLSRPTDRQPPSTKSRLTLLILNPCAR